MSLRRNDSSFKLKAAVFNRLIKSLIIVIGDFSFLRHTFKKIILLICIISFTFRSVLSVCVIIYKTYSKNYNFGKHFIFDLQFNNSESGVPRASIFNYLRKIVEFNLF